MIGEKISVESMVIEELKEYNRLKGRIRILEQRPIGNGLYLSNFTEDDKLQALHRKLRNMPMYMYLTEKEQQLESTATAYLTRYPDGTKSQLRAVQQIKPVDDEDDELMFELEKRIRKIIAVRHGDVEGFKGVIERISEAQKLQDQVDAIDCILDTLDGYKPQYTELLKRRYIQEESIDEITTGLSISAATFDRWKVKAIEEYAKLAGMRET